MGAAFGAAAVSNIGAFLVRSLADAGFDPRDHTLVDERLGAWTDVAAISRTHDVMADLIVNHVSSDSPQFRDVRKKASASPYWDLFLRKTVVFPKDSPDSLVAEEIGRIYRPRPGRISWPLNQPEARKFVIGP